MSHDLPATLGPYQIIREIARSNDIVYEAYDPTMNRRVAIKELAVPRGATPQQQEERSNRFRREAQAVGSLNHPNIMTVYSFAEDGGRSYMAMEFLDGHTLRNEIDTKGFLPPNRAVEIAIGVLHGLEHAHEKGVIHRDIKPDNIQLLSDGSVKITDFGIARLTFQPNLTMDGQVFGTPSYMSPEQVVGREIDARSDLFSVGVILYEMLSGTKPFQGDNVVAITHAIMNVQPSQPAQISYSLWQVIERALDKSPQMRPSSASEMARSLEAASQSANPVSFDPTVMGATPGLPTGAPPIIAPPILTGYPAPPPASYPYNPYAGLPPSAVPPPFVPPTGLPAVPIYYPPPPRRALVSPATKHFLSKLGVAIVLLATFVGLLIGLGSWLGQWVTQQRLGPGDAAKLELIRNIPKNLGVDDQVSRARTIQEQMQTAQAKEQADRVIAEFYRRRADASAAKGDETAAAIDLTNAAGIAGASVQDDLRQARIYEQRAQEQGSPLEQALAWQQAAEFWRSAAKNAPDPEDRREYAGRAIDDFFNYVHRGMESGAERGPMREALYSVQQLADIARPEARAQAEQLLPQLR